MARRKCLDQWNQTRVKKSCLKPYMTRNTYHPIANKNTRNKHRTTTYIPEKLAWKQQITQLKRIIFQTSIFGFHVYFPGPICYLFCLHFFGRGDLVWKCRFFLNTSKSSRAEPLNLRVSTRQKHLTNRCLGQPLKGTTPPKTNPQNWWFVERFLRNSIHGVFSGSIL